MTYLDFIIFFLLFVGCVWFIWIHIVSDLPDDFLTRARSDRLTAKRLESASNFVAPVVDDNMRSW